MIIKLLMNIQEQILLIVSQRWACPPDSQWIFCGADSVFVFLQVPPPCSQLACTSVKCGLVSTVWCAIPHRVDEIHTTSARTIPPQFLFSVLFLESYSSDDIFFLLDSSPTHDTFRTQWTIAARDQEQGKYLFSFSSYLVPRSRTTLRYYLDLILKFH